MSASWRIIKEPPPVIVTETSIMEDADERVRARLALLVRTRAAMPASGHHVNEAVTELPGQPTQCEHRQDHSQDLGPVVDQPDEDVARREWVLEVMDLR